MKPISDPGTMRPRARCRGVTVSFGCLPRAWGSLNPAGFSVAQSALEPTSTYDSRVTIHRTLRKHRGGRRWKGGGIRQRGREMG